MAKTTRTSKRGVKWEQAEAHGVTYWKPVGTTDKFHQREQARVERQGRKKKGSSKKGSSKSKGKKK